MSMSIPRGRIEWNLNTILQLVTLGSLLVAGAYAWNDSRRDIGALDTRIDTIEAERATWIGTHDQLHKDRNVHLSAVEARTDERFRALEAETRKIANLEYRLTVSEQSTLSVVESVKALQEVVNRQGSDIRLALEILQRMESRNGNRPSLN